ncbi:MAG: M23 family metallopeptidase [bacterium]|nr:M23 family metallopeptidase [bacterium]
MKKVLGTLLFLGITFVIRMGTAGIPQETASFEIHQAHSNLLIPEEWVDHAFETGGRTPELLPCEGRISSGFGPRRWGRRMKMHKGLDIAAPTGTPVVAPAKGTVEFVGRKGGYGLTVILNHGGEITTLYGHNSKIHVEEGDIVKKGQVISEVGNTGRSTGPHLHYEVRLDGEQVNPSEYI